MLTGAENAVSLFTLEKSNVLHNMVRKQFDQSKKRLASESIKRNDTKLPLSNEELYNAMRVCREILRVPLWISLLYLWTPSSEEEERTEGESGGEAKTSMGKIIEFAVEELERMQSPVGLLQLWMSCLSRLCWDNWSKSAPLCRYTQKVRITPSTARWLLLTDRCWSLVTDPNQTKSALNSCFQ